jgi:hypothetical protein
MHRWALIATLGLAGCCGPSKAELAAKQAEAAREREVLNKRFAADEEQKRVARESAIALAKERAAKIRAVWEAYDRLPKTSRRNDTWGEALVEGNSHRVGTPPTIDAELEKLNRKEARLRAAYIINHEARTEGERAEILVPSDDRAKCLIWGSQWANESRSLVTMGFEQIHCEEKTHKSRLTGDFVTDPERNWPLTGE